MLNQGKSFVFVVFSIFIIGCGNNINLDNIYTTYLNNNNLIYNQANDSIKKWVDDSLDICRLEFNNTWGLSRIFIFNNDSSRFYTVVLNRDTTTKDSPADVIKDFGGAKINGRWYFFFMGVSEPIVRAFWQDSVYAPLTFEELNYVAYELRLKTLIKNIDDGYPEKNEDIFKNKLFPELPECKGLKGNNRKLCEDSMILKSVKGKYQYKIDAKIIAEINKTMKESVRPPEPVKSWKDKIFAKEKFFESKAWKKRTPMD